VELFPRTRWSLVVRAAGSDPEQARAALGELCRAYWQPLYRFARRSGSDADQARDEIQGFLTALIERRSLAAARAERGRLRSYLLAAFRHYRHNLDRSERAQKRGGGEAPVSIEVEDAERRLAAEPADTDHSPERSYERAWARQVLARGLERLERQYRERDREGLFEALRGHLLGDDDAVPYAKLAERTGLGEGAIKVAVHRLRRRYRDVLRAEVAQTLEDPARADEELRYLASVLRG
jgi:RNA polymerase sigma-70 factor (ECF subfamily)